MYDYDDDSYYTDTEDEIEDMIEQEINNFGIPNFEKWGAYDAAYFDTGKLMSKEDYAKEKNVNIYLIDAYALFVLNDNVDDKDKETACNLIKKYFPYVEPEPEIKDCPVPVGPPIPDEEIPF